jgi:hypothetical protein
MRKRILPPECFDSDWDYYDQFEDEDEREEDFDDFDDDYIPDRDCDYWESNCYGRG